MNLQFYFKSFFVAICLLLSFSLSAQTTISVNTTSAGTLSSKLGSGVNSIVSLTVAGDINFVDLTITRKMSSLKYLDISNASIKTCNVSGIDYAANELPVGIFINKTSLSTCILPNSVTSIGSCAFSYCTGLTSITIPNSVTSINSSAFQSCSGLSSVIIGKNVTSIASGAFFNCTGLTSVAIGDKVSSIGLDAFGGCTKLKEINVSANNPNYFGVENVLFNKNKAEMLIYPNIKTGTDYTIPGSVSSVGIHAFLNCKVLTSVTIGNDVTSIGLGAFDGCIALSSLTIGNKVTTIGNYALSCTGLKKISSKSTTPPKTSDFTFDGIDKTTCKLYVPKGYVSVYKAAAGWSGFTSIVEEALTATAISENEVSSTAVYTEQDAIVVKGAIQGEIISVYSTVGALLQKINAISDETKINLPTNQIYLVRIAGKTFKVAL